MAYCIFLKSLRSLEEFRKNPCVQIPPKSPCANFQCLGKFKNPIFNSKILFPIHFLLSALLALPAHMAFGLASPAGLPSPQAEAFLTGPADPCVDGVSSEMCFPFWFTPSKLVTFSLFSLCQVDPSCQSLPLPRADLSQPCVIPRSEIAGTKPPCVCPGCFIHTYSNNMIIRFHVQKYKVLYSLQNAAATRHEMSVHRRRPEERPA
jgi:hypothetical protein